MFGQDIRLGAMKAGLVWLVATAVLAKTGPFGTFEAMALHMRLCYWCVVVAMSLVIAIALRHLAGRLLARRSRIEQDLLVSLGLGLLFTPLLYGFSQWMSGDAALGMSFAEMLLVVVAVPLLLTLVREAAKALDIRNAEPEAPRLLSRLPEAHRGPIRAVSGRDHYVEVLTGSGTARILLRFSDALVELEGSDGMQVHRSHWVARDAADRIERDGSRTFLRLTCGNRVPVSRTYRDRVIRDWRLDGEADPFGEAWQPQAHAIRTEPQRHPAP